MEAIIFDVDGVLIHSKNDAGQYLWSQHIQSELGLETQHLAKIYSGNWDLVMKGKFCMRQHLNHVFSGLQLAVSVDSFIDYWLKGDLRINNDIVSLVRSIKQSKLYLGTNQDILRARVIWDIFGKDFDGFFPSCNIGAIKPEVEFFRHIENTLNLSPHEIAFVDDSKSHVKAATKRGWVCHHYKDIEELKQFIKKL
ncbi:MAG: HAD-IA family hydrolase [Candidatus Babeliales bacterium]